LIRLGEHTDTQLPLWQFLQQNDVHTIVIELQDELDANATIPLYVSDPWLPLPRVPASLDSIVDPHQNSAHHRQHENFNAAAAHRHHAYAFTALSSLGLLSNGACTRPGALVRIFHARRKFTSTSMRLLLSASAETRVEAINHAPRSMRSVALHGDPSHFGAPRGSVSASDPFGSVSAIELDSAFFSAHSSLARLTVGDPLCIDLRTHRICGLHFRTLQSARFALRCVLSFALSSSTPRLFLTQFCPF
jgi:hypothetical protein